MWREKLLITLLVASAFVGAAMLTDYGVTVLLLRHYTTYSPLVTLAISAIVTFPLAYILITRILKWRAERDALADAIETAEETKEETVEALRAVRIAKQLAETERSTALAASRAKSEFLANMSHELRTPLNAILGFSEMLTSNAFADKREEYARIIHSSARHLLGLVNDLLDLSRIEANKLELRDELIVIGELIRSCVDTMSARANEGRVELMARIEPNLPLVMGDRRALTQIELNLLSNAIKFTGPFKKVEAFAQLERDGHLLFGVNDEGVGISAEDQARLFERFGQGRHDVRHAEKGTGLGLPIVKGLAEAHDGKVTLESQVGMGTCVTVCLPPERLRAQKQMSAA